MIILMLPFIVILVLAIPFLLDPGAVDRIMRDRSRRPPSHPPGWKNKR